MSQENNRTLASDSGFSLRRHLENKGVTTETAMREHLALAHRLTEIAPGISLRRYRPDPDNPNAVGFIWQHFV